MADTESEPEEITVLLLSDALWVTAYKRYYRLWFTLARTSHASEDDAKDIVHGVIAAILSDQGREFSSLEHLRNYVAKAVLNRVILLKQQMRRRLPLAAEHEHHVTTIAEHVLIEDEEANKLIRQAILGLRKKDFEIIKLRFFEGLTFAEISVLLGKPISTLKSREVSALGKLRNALKKRGLESP